MSMPYAASTEAVRAAPRQRETAPPSHRLVRPRAATTRKASIWCRRAAGLLRADSKATVNDNNLSCDVASLFGRQEQNDLCDVVGLTDSSKGYALGRFLDACRTERMLLRQQLRSSYIAR